jgi:hypothetical protein
MRIRVVTSCAILTCAGTLAAGAASCISSNDVAPAGIDGSIGEDVFQPPLGDGGADSSAPVDAGHDATLLSDSGLADSGAVDSGPADSGPADSGPADSGPIDSGPVDSGPADSGDAGPAPCAPVASLAGFVVPPYVPTAADPAGCHFFENSQPLAALLSDCFEDASTYSSCSGFPEAGDDGGAVASSCLTCLFSAEGADADGGYAAIVQAGVPIPNLAGCIQREDPTDAGYTCAEAVQAAWECADFACRSTCPVTDDPSRSAYVACVGAASAGVCSSYVNAANACIAAESAIDAGAGSLTPVQMYCLEGTNELLDFFCGS